MQDAYAIPLTLPETMREAVALILTTAKPGAVFYVRSAHLGTFYTTARHHDINITALKTRRNGIWLHRVTVRQ